MNISKLSQNQRRFVLIVVLSVPLITYGAIGLYDYFRTTHKPSTPIQTSTVTNSSDTPDETKIDDINCVQFKASAKEPKKIDLPSIKTTGCVQKVGVDQNNSIAVPTNVHLAGWFTESSIPGQQGTSIIDGHVSGKYTKGVFSDLNKLANGDEVKVQSGDDSWQTFTVSSISSHPAEKAMEHVYNNPNADDKPKLVLITCGGKYNAQEKTYEDRVIVVASL